MTDDRLSATGTDSGESGYVHHPDGDAGTRSADDAAAQSDDDPEFGTSGWLLVGMLGVAFLLVPGAILVLPAAQNVISALGLTLRDAYLTLPLLPAFALGALAVWSALQSQGA
ncbi:MAG: hypothetical protein ABEH86_13240 [Haloarcula sp.]